MRTSSKIFGILLAGLGTFAAGCALLIPKADHQWYIAGLCWALSFVLLAEAVEKIHKLSKYSDS